MNLGELFFNINLRGGNATLNNIDRIDRRFSNLGSTMKNIGSTMKNVGSTMKNVGSSVVGVGAALTGLSIPIIKVGLDSIKLSSDITESINVVDVTFGKNSKAVQNWAGDLVDSFGLSKREALDYVGVIGSILKISGFSAKETKNMSKRIVELSADLGSFKNLKTEEAFYKIKAGLVGEAEPLRDVGILVDDTTVKHYAMKHGLKKSWKEVTQSEKIGWRYKVMLEQLKDTHGDFGRTSDTLANRIKKIQARFENLKDKIGNKLIPVAEDLLDWVEKAIKWFEKLDDKAQNVIIIMGLIASVIGPLVIIFGGLILAVSGIVTGIGLLIEVFTSILAPILLVVGFIGALVLSFVGLMLSSETVRDALKEHFENIVDKIKDAVKWIKKHIDDIKDAFKGLFKGLITGDYDDFIDAMKKMVPPETIKKIKDIIDAIEHFKKRLADARDKILEFTEVLIDKIEPFVDAWNDAFDKIDFGKIIKGLYKVLDVVMEIIPEIIGIFEESFKDLDVNEMIASFENAKESIKLALDMIGAGLIVFGLIAAGAIGGVIGVVNGIIKAFDNVVIYINGFITFISGILTIIEGIFTGNFDLIKKGFSNMWKGILMMTKHSLDAVIDFISGWVKGVIGFFKNLYKVLVGGSIVPDLINTIVRWFKSLPGKVLGVIAYFVNSVVSKFNSLKSRAISIFNSLKSKVISVWNGIKSKVSSIASSIVSAVSSRLSRLRGTVSGILSGVRGVFISVWSSIKGTVIGIVSGMVSRIKGLISSISGVISGISGKISGLIGKAKSAKSLIPGFASGIRNFGGGLAVVGELGPELVRLPKGTDIYSNTETKGILSSLKPTGLMEATTKTDQIILNGDILIDAKNVEEFNDIVTVLKGVKRYKNMR